MTQRFKRPVAMGGWGILLLACSVGVAAQDTFALKVERRGDTAETGVATLVAPDILVTSSALLSLGEHWTLDRGDGSGPREGAILFRDSDSDVAVIRVGGIDGRPITLAASAPEAGRIVESLLHGMPASRGQVLPSAAGARIEHSAQFPAGQYGSALVNNCGELVGVNQTPLQRRRRATQAVPPSVPVPAAELAQVMRALERAAVSPTLAAAACPTLEQQIAELEGETRRTEEDRVKLEQLRAELAQQNEALEREKAATEDALRTVAGELAATRERLEQLAAERERELAEQAAEQARLREEQERLQAEQGRLEAEMMAREKRDREEIEAGEQRLDQERQQREAQRRWLWLLGALTLLVAAISALMVWRRQRALRTQEVRASRMYEELAKTKATFPDVVLQGRFVDSGDARLKIIGNALARAPSGQVIGRDPEVADLILAHAEVSRQHARVEVRDKQLFVTDLGSFNGTAVNGMDCPTEVATPVNDGDALRIGTAEFTVHFVR
jgi:hypothetical protein